MYCFHFCLLWKTFIAPSILNDSFTGYSILWLKLFSFSAQNTSLHALLAFKVSDEKYAVILMGLLLDVICFISLMAFGILSLFSVLVVSIIICHREVLFWSSLFDALDASCTWIGITFSRFGTFSVIILLNILWIPLLAPLLLLQFLWFLGFIFWWS
jgi:hypothetical protein